MSHPHGDQAESGQPTSPAVEPTLSAATPVFQSPAPVEPTATDGYSAAALTPTSAPTAVSELAPTAAYPAAGPSVPTPAAPVSSMPGYAPVSAVPGYAPGYAPVSAMPGYGPVSAMPYGYAPVAEPKKSRSSLVLSIVAGLLGLAAAGMTTLYFVEHSQRNTADAKVVEQATALKTEQDKAKDLEGKLNSSKSDNAKLTQDLTGAKTNSEQLAKEKEVLAACMRAIIAYGKSPTSKNAKDLDTKCSEADKYI